MTDRDCASELEDALRAAADAGTPLAPRGGGSKDFLGRKTALPALSTATHRGIVSYEPTELIVTARSGTPLAALQDALAGEGQMLPFEPPHYGPAATLGGTVAAGLSGPARPYAGAARDFVLGTRILNGAGDSLRFGGEVMKNVAGYDVSRLMAGAMGTLGVMLDISLKVLPAPERTVTAAFSLTAAEAIARMNEWSTRALPITATAFMGDRLYVRLAGSGNGVATALARVGGETVPDAEAPWEALREHRLDFFARAHSLWRVSLPSTTPPLAIPGESVIEWGGALRWLVTDADADSVRGVSAAAGGHAMAFRGGDRNGDVYHPLEATVLKLHQRLKRAFDPKGILNPGRMYPDY